MTIFLTQFSAIARNVFVALATLLAVGLLASCAQIPSSGGVRQGPEISDGIAGEFPYYSPSGPSDGDSQEEVIRGFLAAGTAPQNDYSTAREYLASTLKGSWSPSETTLVQRGALTLTPVDQFEVRVTTGVQAEVTNQGQFQAKADDYVRDLDFGLVRQDGEWRISAAPNLTVVIAPVFAVIFEQYSLYFFDRQLEYLVPDLRWFPSRASTTTLITSALLDGPSEWLREGVASAIPSGTNLAIDSVAIDAGVAQIDLTARALVAGVTQAQKMRAQLLATLTQVSGVSDVSVSIERTPQDIAVVSVSKPAQNNAYPIALIENTLRQVTGNQAILRNSSYPLSKISAKDFAVDSQQTKLALRDDQGVWVSGLDSIGQSIELIDNRPALLTPSFDAQGYLWLTSASSTSSLVAFGDSGEARQIEAGWLQGMKRKTLAISPDGSRVSVLEQRASGNRLWVSVIVRNLQGQPQRLGSPIEISVGGGSAISVAWSDDASLAVLAQTELAQVPKVIRIGGLVRDLSPVSNGVKILANAADSTIYILNSSGELLQNRGTSWVSISSEITAAHFSG